MNLHNHRPGALNIQVNGIQIEDLYTQHQAYKKRNEELSKLNQKLSDQLREQGILIKDLKAKLAELALSRESVDTNFGGCEGCKHIAFRYPYASMYPCSDCIRANSKDYYNVDLKEV